MKRLSLLTVLVLSGAAHAYTDQRCAHDCRQNGGGWAWCNQRCDFDPAPQMPAMGASRPDPMCRQECAQAGYNWQLCDQRCR